METGKTLFPYHPLPQNFEQSIFSRQEKQGGGWNRQNGGQRIRRLLVKPQKSTHSQYSNKGSAALILRAA